MVPVLVAAWAYSAYPFALALPSERTEAILAGMVAAFSFFGCVPHEVWWDNPTTVVRQILKGRERRPNERYAALASHYAFDPLFCMPARGNEKSHAENRVKELQRQWATPVPQAADLDALNRWLRTCCLREAGHTVTGRDETVGQRFQRDQAEAQTLPPTPFDACIVQAGLVNKYQTVCFDRNRYSVPRCWAFKSVTIKGYIDAVEVVASGRVVARHRRSYDNDEQILDPLHYLAALGRRPAALDHAPVLRDWQLPASFERLRQALERQHGDRPGARQYIRVLQLLAEHPLERVRQAVERCLGKPALQAERVISEVQRLAASQSNGEADAAGKSLATPLDQYQVCRPDLGRFDALLGEGE